VDDFSNLDSRFHISFAIEICLLEHLVNMADLTEKSMLEIEDNHKLLVACPVGP
jgi:hypothetical protein